MIEVKSRALWGVERGLVLAQGTLGSLPGARVLELGLTRTSRD